MNQASLVKVQAFLQTVFEIRCSAIAWRVMSMKTPSKPNNRFVAVKIGVLTSVNR